MAIFEYSDTFDVSAASVFAALVDLEARPKWIAGIQQVQVTPPGPARIGTRYFEAGKFSGYKSEKTLIVTEYEQDARLTLAAEPGVPQAWRESYRLEPLSTHSCRMQYTVDVGNVPKVAEFFMRQEMKKANPQNMARLKALLASRG